ncbi:MAG TPA: radical SAM protein, partial [Desulfuromonas sp.]|nr:radical SAM protein [Desulfuromonas sp.]
MDLLLLHPPATKPAEPPLGLAVLAGHLRSQGFTVAAIDANLQAYLYLLDPERAAAAAGAQPATAVRRALGQCERSLQLLRSPAGVASFPRYATAVRHLQTLLELYTGADERLNFGDYDHRRLSPFVPADLARCAKGEVPTLFAGYFREQLLPEIARHRPRCIALSINYRHQLLPAFELAGLLARAFPEIPLIAGGGMLTSWREVLRHLELHLLPFRHIVFGPGEGPLAQLLRAGGAAPYFLDGTTTCHTADFADFPLCDYLSPLPVLPVSASRGCYWGRCRFCPEASSPTHA